MGRHVLREDPEPGTEPEPGTWNPEPVELRSNLLTREGRDVESDHARFAAILDQYGEVLRRAVVQLCPRDVGLCADEIEQEARVRLWQALRRQADIADPAAYLYKIAVSASIDAVRRVKARREDQMPETTDVVPHAAVRAAREPSPEWRAIASDIADKVRRVIGSLPAPRRLAVRLHVRGFTSQEIASFLGWTEPKARNLTYRGLKTVRERLAIEGVVCDLE